MQNKKCKICKGNFFNNNSINFKKVPSSAQNFPEKNNLKNDRGINLNIFQCSKCGVVQAINKPVSYYKQVIRSSAFSKEMIKFRTLQFRKIINKYNLKGKKIIEIGTGQGEYLSILDKFQVKASGLEFSKKSVITLKNKKLNVQQGYIDKIKYNLKNAPFDAFCIFSYLEHLPNINIVLRALHKNLKNDAIGIIEVPNFNLIIKKKLFSEFIRDHLFYFTKESLSKICLINGFDIVDISIVWHDYIISAIVKKIDRNKKIKLQKIMPLNLNKLTLKKNVIKMQIDNHLKKFKGKKIIAWGAGHQALTLISLTNLSKKISFIVDSATFKQNKYSPSSHIPIISPSQLHQLNFDLVIVLAASYSDEVIRILLKNYKSSFSICAYKENKLITIR